MYPVEVGLIALFVVVAALFGVVLGGFSLYSEVISFRRWVDRIS